MKPTPTKKPKERSTPLPPQPDWILSYFAMEKGLLVVLTFFGLLYNVGLAASPWFQGKLAQCLLNVLQGTGTFQDMLWPTAAYVVTILLVQGSRFFKRLLVRKFGNNINRSMKQVFYTNLIHKSRQELNSAGTGAMMAKAVGDVDACSEGIRKFTTEIFDTGVALCVYVGMLLWYDWRLALLCLIFPPLSYFIAQRMKEIVQRTSSANRECAERLNQATLDRVSSAMTYRIFGCEEHRDQNYEQILTDYEKSAVRAGIPASAMQPLYQAVSLAGALFILWFGSRNVLGTGWTSWDVATFTTFFLCFEKLSVKSSHAAKLFNAVQKAQVSWGRIKEYLAPPTKNEPVATLPAAPLTVEHLGFSYPGSSPLFTDLSFQAKPGDIIGITGPVACGKSTLGRLFLGEILFSGRVQFGGLVISSDEKGCPVISSGAVPGLTTGSEEGASRKPESTSLEQQFLGITGYLGHDPELFHDTIEHNILLGSHGDAWEYLKDVCLAEEVSAMPKGIHTLVGDGGIRLSGGQKQRLALARTLAHPRPLYVLDDPFSALDQATERQVFDNLRERAQDSIVLLLSHRLELFPKTDSVIWMQDGVTRFGTHEDLLASEPLYHQLYQVQEQGSASDNDSAPMTGNSAPGKEAIQR